MMRRFFAVAAIFSLGFLARGLWNGPAVEAAGGGDGGGAAGATISGDVNGDGRLDLADAIYLINYVFRAGPLPVAIECPLLGLPATGQATCFDPAGLEIPCESADLPGQDGFYRWGCPAEGRFVDNLDGTVTDACTGLMWQKNTADVDGDEALGDGDKLDSQAALQYCENLDFAGHDDWRLPNARELQSLVDFGRFDPAIDPVFGATPAYYWSSSTVVSNPEFSWGVQFFGGYVGIDYKVYAFHLRAVRGGPVRGGA